MSLADQINAKSRRIDGLLGAIERRELERLMEENAAQERANAAQARADTEGCRKAQVKYDEVYRDFGVVTPAPVDGERPSAYRKRLYEGLRRRLPSGHDLSEVYADDIPGSAAANFEKMMFEAARAEAKRPSPENLPANGELVQRIVTNPDSGAKEIHWYGKESFIKQFSRPGQHVARICDPRKGIVFWGEDFSRMR